MFYDFVSSSEFNPLSKVANFTCLSNRAKEILFDRLVKTDHSELTIIKQDDDLPSVGYHCSLLGKCRITFYDGELDRGRIHFGKSKYCEFKIDSGILRLF